MDTDELFELMDKAKALADDVANGKASGNDVADKLEDYVKTVPEHSMLGRYCEHMAKKARG